jgi:hypothetical protein
VTGPYPETQTNRRKVADVQAVTEQGPAPRPAIEVLYVEELPNYRGTLALVERVQARLSV